MKSTLQQLPIESMNRCVLIWIPLTLITVGMIVLALVPNSVLIQCYFQSWCALGLDPTAFGGYFRLLAQTGHVLAYAVLTFLLLRFTRLHPRFVIFTAMSLAALLEASQALSATRTPRFADLLASLVGVGLGSLIGHCRHRVVEAGK